MRIRAGGWEELRCARRDDARPPDAGVDAVKSLQISQFMRDIRREFQSNWGCMFTHGGLHWDTGTLPEAGGRALRRQAQSRCRFGRVPRAKGGAPWAYARSTCCITGGTSLVRPSRRPRVAGGGRSEAGSSVTQSRQKRPERLDEARGGLSPAVIAGNGNGAEGEPRERGAQTSAGAAVRPLRHFLSVPTSGNAIPSLVDSAPLVLGRC